MNIGVGGGKCVFRRKTERKIEERDREKNRRMSFFYFSLCSLCLLLFFMSLKNNRRTERTIQERQRERKKKHRENITRKTENEIQVNHVEE